MVKINFTYDLKWFRSNKTLEDNLFCWFVQLCPEIVGAKHTDKTGFFIRSVTNFINMLK